MTIVRRRWRQIDRVCRNTPPCRHASSSSSSGGSILGVREPPDFIRHPSSSSSARRPHVPIYCLPQPRRRSLVLYIKDESRSADGVENNIRVRTIIVWTVVDGRSLYTFSRVRHSITCLSHSRQRHSSNSLQANGPIHMQPGERQY